jgi:hypothetical protein
MQNRIVKSCQPRKNRRTERLKELLSLKQSDSILLDACARKSPQDGNYYKNRIYYIED